jgi:NADH dehydrogenase
MPASAANPVRIIVLGGGFAGYYATMKLSRLLRSRDDVQLALVNQENYLLFTPLLHEVAASDVDPSNIVVPLHRHLRCVDVLVAEVESVDTQNKTVTVSHGARAHRHTLAYDYLLLGLGSVSNFHNLPGVEENCITMKSLQDAFYLRNHMIRQLEVADFDARSGTPVPALTFVVCGGGFAGVETVGAMMDFLQDATKSYRHLHPEMIKLVLVHSGPQLLPELGGQLGRYAAQKLTERGVDIRLDTPVLGFRDGAVLIKDAGADRAIPTNTLVWTAGVMAAPLVQQLPCDKVKGRLLTKPTMELANWPGVFAVGDCAAVPHPGRTGEYYGPTAQNALRQAELAARNIVAAIENRPQHPFAFKELGQLASIGSRRGVANIMGFHFSGFLAWWFWRTVYLYKLPGFRKKLRVALDWTLDVFFSRDTVQFRSPRIPEMDKPIAQPRGSQPEELRKTA